LDGESISAAASAVVEEPSNTVLVSSASIWEVAIMTPAGKLRGDGSILETTERTAFEPLLLSLAHA
jgi:PIN domain nuclease of toxin-antitoxin system